jgi:hypothetical protein
VSVGGISVLALRRIQRGPRRTCDDPDKVEADAGERERCRRSVGSGGRRPVSSVKVPCTLMAGRHPPRMSPSVASWIRPSGALVAEEA